MTVKELREILATKPDDMEVLVYDTEAFRPCVLESANVYEIFRTNESEKEALLITS